MTNPEAQPPLGDEFADISELGAETTDLIYRFRTALVELPEFQRAAAQHILSKQKRDPLPWINFMLGEKTYSVKYSGLELKHFIPREVESLHVVVIDADGRQEGHLGLDTEIRNEEVWISTGHFNTKKYYSATLGYVDGKDESPHTYTNNRTALAKARELLEEIRNPQGEATVQVSDSVSETPQLD